MIKEYDLMDFLVSEHHWMKKEACYALSNVITWHSLPTEPILQQVFSFLLGNDTEVDVKEEALWHLQPGTCSHIKCEQSLRKEKIE